MRLRRSASESKIELQMTPMIDIVFNLLVFFIMTFKIVELEGDFDVKMPAASASQGTPDEDILPPMTLRLASDQAGNLTGIQLNDIGLSSFQELNEQIWSMVGSGGESGSLSGVEIELDFDYQLRYEQVVNAITAVSGRVLPDGTIIKMVEKVRFAPPRIAPGS
jgi:biopolymer transport protein ExbD